MPDGYPTRNPETAWRVYDGQAAILCPDDSTLNTLNAVGTVVWEAADGQTPLGAIVDRIRREFAVEPGRAETDVRSFVEALCRRGLLAVSGGASPLTAGAPSTSTRGEGRRPYEPPEILSQEVFETTALACGKRPGQSRACNANKKS
jgi:hypothetical protein